MNRSAAIAVLILVFAACFGASLMQQRNAAATSPQRPAATPASTQAQEPIDRQHVPELAAVHAPPDCGEQAMAHLREIVAFGARHSGSAPTPGWSQQIEYIAASLARLGLQVERDTWTDPKEHIAFTNVTATIPGKHPEQVVLACHHDTKCTANHPDPEHNFPFVGANDGGSGVALLLALAPVLQARANEASIRLVFFDGEESLDWSWNGAARALFGSRRFVRSHRGAELLGQAPRIAAMVLLDMVGRTDLHIQEELYSTAELRRIAFAAAVATGQRPRFFRESEAASDDHVPFLDVGIPALDLIDLRGNPHWHRPTDTIENVSAQSLQIVADVLLTMLPAIENTYVMQPR